jgi:hypothetical protein
VRFFASLRMTNKKMAGQTRSDEQTRRRKIPARQGKTKKLHSFERSFSNYLFPVPVRKVLRLFRARQLAGRTFIAQTEEPCFYHVPICNCYTDHRSQRSEPEDEFNQTFAALHFHIVPFGFFCLLRPRDNRSFSLFSLYTNFSKNTIESFYLVFFSIIEYTIK